MAAAAAAANNRYSMFSIIQFDIWSLIGSRDVYEHGQTVDIANFVGSWTEMDAYGQARTREIVLSIKNSGNKFCYVRTKEHPNLKKKHDE